MLRRVDLWRTGAVLEDGDNLVLIDVPASDSASIEVVVRGPEPGRTLAILDDIFQRSLGKGAQRRLFVDIPCPCRNGQTPTCAEGHRKDLILQYLHRGDSPVACPSTRTLIRPSRLLFGMEISADDGPGEVGALLRQLVDGQSGIRADQRRLLIGQEVIARGQATSCPATFVIVPKGHNIKFWNTHVQLKLYCGAPGSEHPLPEGVGVYDLTDPPEWLVKVGPYLDKLLKILKVAAPPATAIMGEAAEVLKGRCHDDLDLMDKWLKKAKELSVPGHALALPEAERGPSKVHQLDTEAEFRRVRALLIKQDPARTWGRLIAHTTREGTYYLCEEHFALVGGFAQQRDQD